MAALLLLPLMAASAVAVNYPTIPADLTTPVQQRLAVKGPSSMAIAWNTYGKLNSTACVKYGTSASKLTSEACTNSQNTYATSRTYAHDVTMTGLKPSTTYYYKIVSTNSTVDHFVSPRTPGDKTAFNMDVVIDLGIYGPDGYTTTKRDTIPAVQPDLNHATIGRLAQTVSDYELIIHPGDLAYADDWFEKPDNVADGKDAYQAILEGFYEQLQPISGRKAYMASPGNHEAACEEVDYTANLCPEGQHNFTDFMMRFGQTMPTAFGSSSKNNTAKNLASQAQALALPPFWYSFEYGMAHVVMIDTETDFPNAPDQPGGSANLGGGPFGRTGQQLDFVKADLASVDRSVTPWVIVAGHRPWYSTGGSDNICTPCQTAFESLFYEYGVDLAVFGHVHNSQRFDPVYNNTADRAGLNNPKAPMYIVAGGPGNIEGLSSVGDNYSTNVFAYADDFSYAQIKFKDAKHLGVDFIRSSTGEILDSSVLYKAHNVSFVRN
ncbi:hypothetical protein DOTSEDRAFT_180664 [Dothistroma septosporum NZE10]|uniref:Purple acid phosphatase n=1 Tax=Dothistroma septosporum (strain NZE10 / CBS 128990) TaxID=675120 RepID=M2Y0C9_DOTSN|nr:hypothetical protein DOTSEDRAFT_180664 [Dothistroma septosporum NZE10]